MSRSWNNSGHNGNNGHQRFGRNNNNYGHNHNNSKFNTKYNKSSSDLNDTNYKCSMNVDSKYNRRNNAKKKPLIMPCKES